MIKLQRGVRPTYLSDQKVQELTDIFKANKGEVVWKHKEIHNALLISSFNKCAFCETKLQISSSYMEIEHFKSKDLFPEDVVDWNNLLPSCKRCNTTKSKHNVVLKPIINPFDIDPKDHLTQQGCRIYFKTDMGESTQEALNLNDEKLTRPRFEVWDYVVTSLEEMYKDLTQKTKLTKHDRNKLCRLLTSCQADRAFSAFASTALHQTPEYSLVINALRSAGQWDDQLEDLHQNSLRLVLDKR